MSEATKTKWEGLWNNREGVYSGRVIKKADIPAYARLILRYNKYYEKDGNRPRFVYCFANGDAADAITLEQETDDQMTLEEAENLLEKIEELRNVMRRGNSNGDVMMLPSESMASANELMKDAIRLVEEITGEEWEFSYITF